MASYAYRPGNFCRVPMPLQAMRLPNSAPSVFMALCYHADINGKCWPSRATLAAEVGVSIDTVDRAMKAIEKAGLVRVTRRGDTSNVYQLTVSDSELAAPTPPGGLTDAATPSLTGAALTRLSINYNHQLAPAGAEGGSNSEEEKAIGEAIKEFSRFSTSYQRFFKQPPQREACRRLIRSEKIGLSRIKTALKVLSESRDDRFAPLVDNPVDLESKWAKVYRYVKPKVKDLHED